MSNTINNLDLSLSLIMQDLLTLTIDELLTELVCDKYGYKERGLTRAQWREALGAALHTKIKCS